MNRSVSPGPSSPDSCASAHTPPPSDDRSPSSRRVGGSTAGSANRRFVWCERRTNTGAIWNGCSRKPAPAGISLPTPISLHSPFLTAPHSSLSTTTSLGFETCAGSIPGAHGHDAGRQTIRFERSRRTRSDRAEHLGPRHRLLRAVAGTSCDMIAGGHPNGRRGVAKAATVDDRREERRMTPCTSRT